MVKIPPVKAFFDWVRQSKKNAANIKKFYPDRATETCNQDGNPLPEARYQRPDASLCYFMR